jgi:predicted O-methyltransferase YrrM
MSLRRQAIHSLHALFGQNATEKIRQKYRRWRHSRGTLTWATKSYEVWLILQTELYLIQPRVMVEFGSGRSTNYLAEYAYKQGARLISIEEHAVYATMVNRVLRDSFLPNDVVHHVPVHDDWYDVRQVEYLLRPLAGTIDFLFLDGPCNVGQGKRSSQAFGTCVVPMLGSLRMAVVDDVHRPECDATARRFTEDFGMIRQDVAYGKASWIAFLHSTDVASDLALLPDFLRRHIVSRPGDPLPFPRPPGTGDQVAFP